MIISFSKTDKQNRYRFNIFEDYEEKHLQKVLHLLRIIIDKKYYYDKESAEECIEVVNRIIYSLNLKDEVKDEMQRKAFYHLSKHIILNIDKHYNIKEVYKKEWIDEQ